MINECLKAIFEFAIDEDENSKANIAAKKKFSQALFDIIDGRIQFAFDARRKSTSKDRVDLADSINHSVQVTATTVKSIAALNSAPPPPKNVKSIKSLEGWMERYRNWYNNEREDGMKIG